MRKVLLVACVALSLQGCAAASLVGGLVTAGEGVQTTTNTVVLSSTKALAVAADAYAGAAQLATTAVKNGHFSDDQLRMLSVLNDRAQDLLNGADSTLTVAQRAASLMLIVGQLHSIVGK